MITQERLKEVFKYSNGSLIRLKRYRKSIPKPYISLSVDGAKYYEHRLVWIYHNGAIPDYLQVDHINGIKHDNRIENLRVVTRQENNFNTHKSKGYRKRGEGRYEAYIQLNGKTLYLGVHKTSLEARQAYLTAKQKYHKIKDRRSQ